MDIRYSRDLWNWERKQGEEETLARWSRWLCCLPGPKCPWPSRVLWSWEATAIPAIGFADYNFLKKNSLCLERDSWWSQLECLKNWEVQILGGMYLQHALSLKEPELSTEKIEGQDEGQNNVMWCVCVCTYMHIYTDIYMYITLNTRAASRELEFLYFIRSHTMHGDLWN